MFRGFVGKSFTEDIAIDDINRRDGECPLPGMIMFHTVACLSQLKIKLCVFHQFFHNV